jgi:hypothetical protein
LQGQPPARAGTAYIENLLRFSSEKRRGCAMTRLGATAHLALVERLTE